jgi:hypothetical protein
LVNPVEQFFQILLRTRKFGFRLQLFSGLHTLEKLFFRSFSDWFGIGPATSTPS